MYFLGRPCRLSCPPAKEGIAEAVGSKLGASEEKFGILKFAGADCGTLDPFGTNCCLLT